MASKDSGKPNSASESWRRLWSGEESAVPDAYSKPTRELQNEIFRTSPRGRGDTVTTISGVTLPAQQPQASGSWNAYGAVRPKPVEPSQANRQAALSTRDAHSQIFDFDRTRSEEFTPEEYAGLSDRQRSLVDAQTALWNAVQADKEANLRMSSTERRTKMADENYKNAISALFTDQGGSEQYAPQTVALLSQLGMDSKNNDLDQYLRGSAFLSKQEILDLPDEVTAGEAPYAQYHAQRLANSAQATGLSDLLEQGQSLLSNIGSDGPLGFAAGTAPKDPLSTLTTAQVDGLRTLMQGMALAQRPADLGDYYDSIKNDYGLDDDLIETFLRRELDNWEQGRTQFGEGYVSPQDFRTTWRL